RHPRIAFEEADARMTAPGMGEEENAILRHGGAVVGADVELLQCGLDLVRREAEGLVDLVGCEAVVPDEILKPVAKLGIVARAAGIDGIGCAGVLKRRGECEREDGDDSEVEPGAGHWSASPRFWKDGLSAKSCARRDV